MTGKNRIYLNKISKKFRRKTKGDGALGHILSVLSFKNKNEFWALRDIDFNPEPQKITGIIGRNGSGKSTLLRIIAGIYQPTNGQVKIDGELAYLTGFGQGLMPKLTMKENIYLIGALLGLNNKEIRQRLEEIVEFSELNDYLNSKVFQFSSGMVSRLSFSTTIHCIKHKNPDILLIDEALEGGADLSFKNKALKKMEELIVGGSTVILVSHSPKTIEQYCHQVLWLEQGKNFKTGSAGIIIPEYIKTNQ